MSYWRDFWFGWQMKIGRYPVLYYALFAHRFPFNRLRVNRDTELCIEGFPRSANSYAVVAFKLVNPETKIAHHLHVPAQIRRAVALHIPAVLIIRKPEDAVSSFLIFQQSEKVDRYLRAYIEFYTALLPIMEKVLVVDFKLIVSDVNRMIQAINQRFNRHYRLIDRLEERQEEIFTKLEEYNQRFFGGGVHKSTLPHADRERWKAEIKARVQQSPLLETAQTIYERFLQRAVQ
ncbi:MAG: hypothetical protein GXO78_02765 [Calditrichaeota bacterium]|nr:hypothetical protein [Calditrichota bacterium]